jgi:phage/plasmid-like protein (TIGR03299 family)
MILMPANVESMFYVRETPWHGLGIKVEEALSSSEALSLGGLDWKVIQKEIYTNDSMIIPSFKANIREIDNKVLGVVTERYKIVQNKDAFAFTDNLIGEGCKYETAGSLQEGRKVWMLAKLPEKYQILDDEITPYMVFSNSHDGSGAIKIAMTPIRVVCNNTLNLALSTAKRIWSANHTGNVSSKLDEAMQTLLLGEHFMRNLTLTAEELNKKRMTDRKVNKFINELLPLSNGASKTQEKNIEFLRNDMKFRYFDAPDLRYVPKTAWRFVNAVSDFATHITPLRKTENYKENLFSKTIDGNPIIDKAYEMVKCLV